MLPVSAWPPGPPGSQLSPFGRPRTVRLNEHPRGYVLPKGQWVVQTGSNRVVMFRPPPNDWWTNNPPRTPGTGILPGQGPGYGPWPPRPTPPRCPPRPDAIMHFGVRANAAPSGSFSRGVGSGAGGWAASPAPRAAEAVPSHQSRFSSQENFEELTKREAHGNVGRHGLPSSLAAPSVSRETGWRPRPPYRFWRHNDYVEAWRAWQRAIGRTDPPIRPLPGRRPPNWFGWSFTRAPGSTLIPAGSAGTVIADGQNVVITGAGHANVTQAFNG